MDSGDRNPLDTFRRLCNAESFLVSTSPRIGLCGNDSEEAFVLVEYDLSVVLQHRRQAEVDRETP
jgi:hypothetical protein